MAGPQLFHVCQICVGPVSRAAAGRPVVPGADVRVRVGLGDGGGRVGVLVGGGRVDARGGDVMVGITGRVDGLGSGPDAASAGVATASPGSAVRGGRQRSGSEVAISGKDRLLVGVGCARRLFSSKGSGVGTNTGRGRRALHLRLDPAAQVSGAAVARDPCGGCDQQDERQQR